MEESSLFDPDRYLRDRPSPPRRSGNRSGDRETPDAPEPQLLLDEELGIYKRDPLDGLIARVVQTHSLEKAWYARRYADIVGRAMRSHFRSMWWVELFAGPGRLYVAPEQRFAMGSPLDALSIPKPFDGYFFSDLNSDCAEALRIRTERSERRVHVECGDANSAEIHDEVLRLIPWHALVVLYLDPEGLELDFRTIDRFARRFGHLDLLVNFPAPGAARAAGAGHLGPVQAVVGVDDSEKLLDERGRLQLRPLFAQQLDELGLRFRVARSVQQRRNRSPLYDLVLASRSSKAPELFAQATAVHRGGQRELPLDL